jgi:hypothetical protein
MSAARSKVDPDAQALLSGMRNLRDGLADTSTQAVCRSNLSKHVLAYLKKGKVATTVVTTDWDKQSQDERELLSEACYVALTNEAPAVAEYEVSGDFGPYSVFIRGVSGAYFIEAIERDPMGPFPTLTTARAGVDLNWREAKKIS